MTGLTAYEALAALTSSPHITAVMRRSIDEVLREHGELRAALEGLLQAYSVPKSPPHRKAMRDEARRVLEQVDTEGEP